MKPMQLASALTFSVLFSACFIDEVRVGDSYEGGGGGAANGGSAGGKSGSGGAGPVQGGASGASGASGAGGAGGASGQGGASGGGPPPVVLTGGDSCANPIPLLLGYGPGTNVFVGNGDTAFDAAPTSEPRCESELGITTAGPDRVHRVELDAPEGGYVTARLVRGDNQTAFDAALYVRETCEGAASYCADAFLEDGPGAAGARQPARGGDLLTFAVAPDGPKTFFLYVDGVTAADQGAYALEISLARGTCDDPIPLFLEEGSPVRGRASNQLGDNVQLTCGTSGTRDVIYRVTRAAPGPLGIQLQSEEAALGFAVFEQACDPQRLFQEEQPGSCQTGGDAFYSESAWPGPDASLFLAIDVGAPFGLDRTVEFTLDPSGGLRSLTHAP